MQEEQKKNNMDTVRQSHRRWATISASKRTLPYEGSYVRELYSVDSNILYI